MSSSPLPSKIRPNQNHFLDDLTQVFRRHKIHFGDRSDLDHLATDLQTNEGFRSDLFSLCTAISHMSESDLSPEELLHLVARALTGGRRSGSAIQIPERAREAFLRDYDDWARRAAGLETLAGDPEDETGRVWQLPANPFSTAATLAKKQPQPEVPRERRPESSRALTPETPIGSLTLGELKSYLEDIEQRVSRLQPFLDAVSKTSAAVHAAPTAAAQKIHPAAMPIPIRTHEANDAVNRSEPDAEVYPADAPAEDPHPVEVLPEPVEISNALPHEASSSTAKSVLNSEVLKAGDPEARTAAEDSVAEKPQEADAVPAAAVGEAAGSSYARWEVFRKDTAPPPARTADAVARPEVRGPWRSSPGGTAELSALDAPAAVLAPRQTDWTEVKPSRWTAARIIPAAAAVLVLAGAAVGGYEFFHRDASPAAAAAATAPTAVTGSAAVPATPTEPTSHPGFSASKQVAGSRSRTAEAAPPPIAATPKPAAREAIVPTATVASASGIASALKPILNVGTSPAPPSVSEPAMRQPAPSLPAARQPAVVPAPTVTAPPVSQPIEPYNQRTVTPPEGGSQPAAGNVAANVRPSAPTTTPAPITRIQPPGNLIVSVPSPTMMTYAISTPTPEYPSFRRPTDTAVVIQATIGKDGRVIGAQPVDGASDLAAAAVRATRNWRFRPYIVNGSPVQVVTNIKFVFKGTH